MAGFVQTFERGSGDGDIDPDNPKVQWYSLEEEKHIFKGDYRQRETELRTRLKGKKTPMGQDRVGVLTEAELHWVRKDKLWRKEIEIQLDTPRRRSKGPKPVCPISEMKFKVCGEGSTVEKALDKAWLAIVNAFHARMNPKAPVPKNPTTPEVLDYQKEVL